MIQYRFNGLFFILTVTTALLGSQAWAQVPRGEMLYENHCMQCHIQEIHWREKKRAIDKKSLIDQVDRWQRAAELAWSKQDIEEVSRYLNDKYYHYPF